MKNITVDFQDFWQCSKDEFAGLAFMKAFEAACKNIGASYSFSKFFPKVKFFSIFSKNKFHIKMSSAKVKVFFTGEDVDVRFTAFKDYCTKDCDLSLGFRYEDELENATNYLRYPLWILYYFGYTEDKDKIRAQVKTFNDAKSNAGRFACLVASHDDQGMRQKMCNIINAIAPVSCGGKFLHNDETLKTEFGDDKIAYLKNFMFNLCPENVSVKGYVTEKIFQSFLGGCIPIYFGSDGTPEPDVINQKAMICLAKSDLETTGGGHMRYQINELWNNKKAYEEFIAQPRLLTSAVDYIYERHKLLREKFEDILQKKL